MSLEKNKFNVKNMKIIIQGVKNILKDKNIWNNYALCGHAH